MRGSIRAAAGAWTLGAGIVQGKRTRTSLVAGVFLSSVWGCFPSLKDCPPPHALLRPAGGVLGETRRFTCVMSSALTCSFQNRLPAVGDRPFPQARAVPAHLTTAACPEPGVRRCSRRDVPCARAQFTSASGEPRPTSCSVCCHGTSSAAPRSVHSEQDSLL